jgi:hypothetical protein
MVTGIIQKQFLGFAFDGRLDPDPEGLKRTKMKGKTRPRDG